jgi:hypothetical protein
MSSKFSDVIGLECLALLCVLPFELATPVCVPRDVCFLKRRGLTPFFLKKKKTKPTPGYQFIPAYQIIAVSKGYEIPSC